MKKLSILVILVMTISLSCKKNKVDENAYIPECENISGGTMESRQDQCKSCCKNNGWNDGTFWELGAQQGCECYKLGESAMNIVPTNLSYSMHACVTERKEFGFNHFATLGFANKWRLNTYSENPVYTKQL